MGEGDGEGGWWMLPPMECMFKIGDALGELGQFEEGNRYIKKGIARCIRANASEALTQLLSVLEWNTKEIIKEWDEIRWKIFCWHTVKLKQWDFSTFGLGAP